MRILRPQELPRRKHFEFFRTFDHPHFNICADVDLTTFQGVAKELGASFTVGLVYMIARTANEIPEFRQRIRSDTIVEHDSVHPSATILGEGDLFGFCFVEYGETFGPFAIRAAEAIERVKREPTLVDEAGRDDLLFMTAIPWVSFTSFAHPMNLDPPDTIPRFAWGRARSHEGSTLMPLSVQVHHALMDGIHVGRYFERLQGNLNRAAELLATA